MSGSANAFKEYGANYTRGLEAKGIREEGVRQQESHPLMQQARHQALEKGGLDITETQRLNAPTTIGPLLGRKMRFTDTEAASRVPTHLKEKMLGKLSEYDPTTGSADYYKRANLALGRDKLSSDTLKQFREQMNEEMKLLKHYTNTDAGLTAIMQGHPTFVDENNQTRTIPESVNQARNRYIHYATLWHNGMGIPLPNHIPRRPGRPGRPGVAGAGGGGGGAATLDDLMGLGAMEGFLGNVGNV